MTESLGPVLQIDDLSLALPKVADRQYAIRGLSLSISPGETLCVVGESGWGKSMTALAAIGLLPGSVKAAGCSIKLAGRNLLGLSESQMRDVRGREIGMIFQEGDTRVRAFVGRTTQATEESVTRPRDAATVQAVSNAELV